MSVDMEIGCHFVPFWYFIKSRVRADNKFPLKTVIYNSIFAFSCTTFGN